MWFLTERLLLCFEGVAGLEYLECLPVCQSPSGQGCPPPWDLCPSFPPGRCCPHLPAEALGSELVQEGS